MTRVVGLDLGTTNTALAVATDGTPAPFPIAQVVAPGQVAPRPTLPSFLYLAAGEPHAPETYRLPWSDRPDECVGEHARARGAEVPARLVSSAKSWLSHPAADRTAPILPWGADAALPHVSPVEASARYLEHVAGAWGAAHPDEPLGAQDVFLTVPASFDAVARELTMEAARRAGLEQVTLLEEPQAAFYAWLAAQGDGWREQLRVGDLVLVCDIGGGTSDFSLIEVAERDGDLALERVAVGDHILLGGDNMDLALAYAVMQKLAAKGTKLDAWQQRQLISACRGAKEQILAGTASEVPVSILGRSSKLIGGTLRTELTRTEVEGALVDGFFPRVARDAVPQRGRRTGLQELGLPYAADAAITRHLADFVARAAGGRAPTAILYNGGVMKGDVLRRRLHETVRSWGAGDLRELGGTDLDLAVAHGAAYAGVVRRGKGIRIRGGSAQSYYIGVETAMPAVPGVPPPIKAVCVVPFGLEEGSRVALPGQEFGLVVGEPAEFRFLGSAQRPEDAVGTVLDEWDDELTELAPLETVLPAAGTDVAGTLVPVQLEAHLTEIGTLELSCVAKADPTRRWKLEWSLRG